MPRPPRPFRLAPFLLALALLICWQAAPAWADLPVSNQDLYSAYQAYGVYKQGRLDVSWDQVKAQEAFYTTVDTTETPKPANGFFDFFTDWLDWFNDKKDEVTGDKYDDAGIPHRDMTLRL